MTLLTFGCPSHSSQTGAATLTA